MPGKRAAPASNLENTKSQPKKKTRKVPANNLEPTAKQPKATPKAPVSKSKPTTKQPSISILEHNDSVFDGMSTISLSKAFRRYYENPRLLPSRESEAERRVRIGPLPIISVNFDENIFHRSKPLRPIPDHEKEGVDPFDTTRPENGIAPEQSFSDQKNLRNSNRSS